MTALRRFAVLVTSLLLTAHTYGETGSLLAWQGIPLIRHLSVLSDPLFQQQQDLVEDYYEAIARGDPLPDLSLFRYTLKPEDNVFSLAGSFNLPYDTLSTLNGWSNPQAVKPGQTILVPSQPGLFLNRQHPGEIDRLLKAWNMSQKHAVALKLPTPEGIVPFTFFPGERFGPQERSRFLGTLFRFPLPHAILTSPFGMRPNPFTGKPDFHAGVDLAAPIGTDVFAAQDGTVADLGYNPILGNHIILKHAGGWETVYAHLSRILVFLNETVRSGTIIGKVGSTGESTGPHLHFEIKKNGIPVNPLPLLPVKF
ncbi:MAG: M23 family metallopeptidase [Spirochaetales bacterium]|nr:M23 family metallopeptidase [Spirochaetales bacterium]